MALVVLLLAAACGPGGPADGTGSTSDGMTGGDVTIAASTVAPTTSTSGSSGSSGTSGTSEVTIADTTTTTTSGSSTSDGGATSTAGFEPCEDTILATTFLEDGAGTVPKCVDAQVDWKSEHIDCKLDCSTMTDVHGDGPAAGMSPVTQVTFGIIYGACGTGITLRQFHLGHPVKPQAIAQAYLECALDPWLGEHPVGGNLSDETPFDAVMMIDSYAGDWFSADPVDPPRLLGSFSGDLVGPFEAVHCAALDLFYDNCG
jgi:hypothetical protein